MSDQFDNNPNQQEMELSLEDILFMIKRRFWWGFLTVIAVVAATLGYLQVATPKYTSSVTLKVNPSSQTSSVSSLFSDGLSMGSGSSNITTEIELIKSKANLKKVVEQLDLVDVLIDPDSPARETQPEEILTQIAVNKLSGGDFITVSPVKNTQLVQISVEMFSPELAKNIASLLAEIYNTQLKEYAQREFTIRREFLETQIPSAEKALNESILAIRQYKENAGIFNLSSQASYILNMFSQYDTEIDQYEMTVKTKENSIEALKVKLKDVDEEIITSETISINPLVQELRSKLTNAKIDLASLEELYPDTDARIITKKKTISEIENELSTQVTQMVTSQQKSDNPMYSTLMTDIAQNEISLLLAQSNLEAVKEARSTYEKRLWELPKMEQELVQLEREKNLNEELFTLLSQKLEEARIAEASVAGNSFVVDEAQVPLGPSSPKKMLTLAIGGVLGIFLGILLIFVIEYADKTIRSEDEIERFVHNTIPILGRIPKFKTVEGKEMITHFDPTSPESEAIKMAANNVLYMRPEETRIFAVTSAGPSEGKTTFVGNTANILSQNGEKVLVMDLDMRKPRIEKFFNISSTQRGVVNYFAGQAQVNDLIINVHENVYVLPVGPIPPNPTALLASKKLLELFDQLKLQYDRIIIDTPPVMAAADINLFAGKIDGVVMVTMVNKTRRPSFKIALNNLRNSKADILGFVVNAISSSNSNYYYYYNKDGQKKKRNGKRK
ncbi:MAG TPA: polysaccharide biosynthesis tyrosine autokinase [Thermotogota bacterium]|nr:polysaccharide biosynthesis tyrosine autokinase [Thermotogota bacterium]HPR95724.1 polysaccharide biosynthesis tyrosine autokinase [Thermotogota bacterium]